MKRVWLPLALSALCAVLAVPRAGASCSIGGHDETSENFTINWSATLGASPGAIPGGITGSHLLISEVGARGASLASTGGAPDSSEFIEIYNPTSWIVSLDNKYLSDDISYWRIVNGPVPVANTSDFVLKFPQGLRLNPGRTVVICVTKVGFATAQPGGPAAAAQYFLEMRDSNGNAADDMVNVGTGTTFPTGGGMLTNPSTTNGEWVVLFCWDGASDLVCDVDYASWGANSASNPKMNKTGISADGPDAGAVTSAYNPDTAPATQTNLGTALNRPFTYQRTAGGSESGERPTGGNGCAGKLTLQRVYWVPGTGPVPTVQFHAEFRNTDEDAMSAPNNVVINSQEFGVFLPDYGPIGQATVPPLAPDSFFDVFIELPLSQLPPPPEKRIGGPGNALKGTLPAAYGLPARTSATCPPDTNWAGNVDIQWNAGGTQGGQVNKHYADLMTCAGGAPSFIHFRPSNCTSPMPWSIAGVCPGFSVTLVNEDFSPAPNPVPVGWSGWIQVQAAAAAVGTNCCFSITFGCNGATSAIDICSYACQCQPTTGPNPQPGTIEWTNVPGTSDVRFHVRWTNPSPSQRTAPASGQMSSQDFGVFLPNHGPIGGFSVPPLAPNSFFDVFVDIPLSQLPPTAPISGGPANLTAGGPGRAEPLSVASHCPPDTTWAGNVDLVWNSTAGTAQTNYHFGALQVCPGSGATNIHVRPVNCPSGTPASWSIAGLCPGFNATLLNEDYTPAPNPVPPGWSGWISVTAAAGTPVPVTCCFEVTFVCDNVPGVIKVCATTCHCQTAPNPVPGTIEWTTQPGTTKVEFHVQWTNPSNLPSAPISGSMSSQEFGLGLPNLGTIGTFTVPSLPPGGSTDIFLSADLGTLPPNPPTQGEPTTGPCPPGTHWDGNVDIIWSGAGGPGEAHKHIGDISVCAPGASMIHVKGLLCPSGSPLPWSITGGCPGVTLTLLNEDLSPAPNPVPSGWTGWIQIAATAAAAAPSQCCFSITFLCDNVPGVLDLCANICNCQTPPNPTLSTVEWTTVGSLVRFHFQWTNPGTTDTGPISGDVKSQPFGVFLPPSGSIGPFQVPPLAPNSFFDVFFEAPLASLPPNPPKELPGGGPGANAHCPQDNHWDGNVDVHWTGQAGTAQANYHFGTILLNTGGGSSFIHVISGCQDPAGSTWSLTGGCPGVTAKLQNEDHSPAPAQLPPNWTGWLQLNGTGAPAGQTCCFNLKLTCGPEIATIKVCATTCYWGTLGVGTGTDLDFAIRSIVPNPSSGSTTVGFTLAKADRAKVEVFDAAGHRVRTLVDGAFGAGSHMALWDGRTAAGDLAKPGTYFIRLSAGARTASHKLVLQR